MRLPLLCVLLFSILLAFPSCRCVEPDGDLNDGIDVENHIYNTHLASSRLAPFARRHGLSRGWLTPVLAPSPELRRRAQVHLQSDQSRFTVMSIARNGDIRAYSTYRFYQPNAQRPTYAVLMLKIVPAQNAVLIGEARFPAGLTDAAVDEAWELLNTEASWDRWAILGRYGRRALQLD